MATDVWTGDGNWTTNPTDWSTGSPPTSTSNVEIDGSDTLSTSATVDWVTIDNASLILGSSTVDSLNVTGRLNNAGQLDINSGSSLTVHGVLYNFNTVTIGGTNLTANTTVTVGGLENANAGYLALQGNASSGASDKATLKITGAAPTAKRTLCWRLAGDARPAK